MLALLKSESLLLILAFTLLLSTAGAESNTELQKQSQLDCYAAGWIRAPDLYPGLSTPADARLYLNGTACDQINRWEVGLRFKERSILRFAASNVTLPQRPEWNYTQSDRDDADVQGPAILPGNDHMRYGSRTLDDDSYDKLMRDYESKLRDANLWVVRAVERSVFDSRVELNLHGNDKDTVTVDNHDFYAVRQFHVHVPFTNYPPRTRDSMMYGSLYGDLDVSSSESMFEYYYLLTTDDGTEIDVIAGQSGFLPKRTGDLASMERIRQDITLAQPSGRPSEVPPHIHDPSWPPTCDSGADANFTVSLSIANDAQFESGATQNIEVQVDRVGNTTEYPSRIKLSIVTCTTDSWALGYAVNDLQREAADDCWTNGYLGRRFYSSGPDRAHTLLMQEESLERLCGPEHRVDEDDDSYDFWGIFPNSYRTNSIALATDSWTAPIEVDLTVHRNNTPSFNATFVSYRNMIRVDLETQYTCDEPSSATANELTKSDAWGPRPCASRTRRSRRRHVGLVPITILAGGDQASQGVKVYTDPLAEAIVLNTQSTFSGQFPLVNSTWQTDFEDWDLVQRKYSVWERGSSSRSSDRRIDHGGASNLVSDAWARKKCPEYWASQRRGEIAIAGPQGQKSFGV